MPEAGQLGGAIDALKNVVYVLTVPFFDIVRRILARRKQEREHTPAPEQPNLLTVAFVSALTLLRHHRGAELAHGLRRRRHLQRNVDLAAGPERHRRLPR